jgi:ribulose-5-phosphate 4-epimerase/fuculose-1-phosphate aldolase
VTVPHGEIRPLSVFALRRDHLALEARLPKSKEKQPSMDILTQKFEEKIIRAGLAAGGSVLFIARDPSFISNPGNIPTGDLESVLTRLGRNVLLFVEPAEPYRTIIDCLAAASAGVIYPRDFETSILLRDLPVIDGVHPDVACAALQRRRGVIVRNRGIVTTAGSLEMAFVAISSVCFASFVKFFSDHLVQSRNGNVSHTQAKTFMKVADHLDAIPEFQDDLMKGPFDRKEAVLGAMTEAGNLTVSSRLVDSNFGNISYRLGDTLYISRRGGALDELANGIVGVHLRGEEPVPKTVSTEFPAHREVLTLAENRAVLHGHPKFTVILSMACDRHPCEFRDRCQTACPYERSVAGIPIVPGEAGDGPYGLSHTVPPAMRNGNAAIVYGHGIFTAGRLDYNQAFRHLVETEKACRRDYFGRL